MRLATLGSLDSPRLALVRDDVAYDVAAAAKRLAGVHAGLRRLRTAQDAVLSGNAGLKALDALLRDLDEEKDGQPFPASCAPPLTAPSKVIAIGQNYLDHCREQGVEPPERPMVFAKFPSSLTGHGGVVSWDPALASQVDYEVELAFVIGRKARHVPKSQALEHVAGYMVANDVSARDLQYGDKQWVRGKSLDSFCPTGPVLVTRDEVEDPQALRISMRVNDEIRQDSNTSNLIFDVPDLVAFLSRSFTLYPGDIVLTGTPPGVGVFRKPPVFLADGDRMQATIEGLGTLSNTCRTRSA
jgi:2-keto-4-pentenoate hydratase/2-oxohepta-3-ene-1,7-dioic acid hydratase in catechol pathway